MNKKKWKTKLRDRQMPIYWEYKIKQFWLKNKSGSLNVLLDKIQ